MFQNLQLLRHLLRQDLFAQLCVGRAVLQKAPRLRKGIQLREEHEQLLPSPEGLTHEAHRVFQMRRDRLSALFQLRCADILFLRQRGQLLRAIEPRVDAGGKAPLRRLFLRG